LNKDLERYLKQVKVVFYNKSVCPVKYCEQCFIYSDYLRDFRIETFECTEDVSFLKAKQFIKKYSKPLKETKIKNKCVSIW
jgi:hypothetical protein